MAKLTAKTRAAIPSGDFAGPGRSFPMEDANHAWAALSMAHNAADPGAIRAAVHRKYPNIGQKGSNRTAHGAGMHHDAAVSHSRDGR